LLSSNAEVHENIRPLLRLSRDTIVRSQETDYALVSSLHRILCCGANQMTQDSLGSGTDRTAIGRTRFYRRERLGKSGAVIWAIIRDGPTAVKQDRLGARGKLHSNAK
jgi:hypothetical protein